MRTPKHEELSASASGWYSRALILIQGSGLVLVRMISSCPYAEKMVVAVLFGSSRDGKKREGSKPRNLAFLKWPR